MAENTAIEWTDHTFNPWEGCQKVGPGCDHCYAETRNARYAGGTAINWGPGAPRRRTSISNWNKPLRWQREAAAFYAKAFDRSGEGAGATAAERAGLGVQEDVAYSMRAKRPDAVAFAIQERAVSENPNAGPQGKGYQPDVSYTLEARHHVQAVAFSMRGRDGDPQAEPAPDGLAPSLRTMGGGSSHAFVATGWAVRRLTPRECERLMGVPDDFTAITYRGKPAADGPRYKALGNSQGANKMRWVARGLLDVIAAQGGVA